MTTLRAASEDRARGNSFDALRLLAALSVVVAHSYVLTGSAGGIEAVGAIGVPTFFAVSGFLITQSWMREPAVARFAVKRILRLLPALAAVTALCAYVLGPLVTTSSPGAYLSDPQTHLYVLENLLMSTAYTLPGTFEGLPNGSVNGSLWTLQVEVQCYVLVALAGVAGLLRRAWAVVAAWAVAAVLTVPALAEAVPGGWLALAMFSDVAGMTFVGVFAGAAVLYVMRERVPLRPAWLALAAALWAASIPTAHHQLATVVLAPYIVIAAGYLVPRRWTRHATRFGDLSYGTYLVAFPVQQALQLWLAPGPSAMMLMSVPLSLLLAALCWRLVERPALALKARPRSPAPDPGPTSLAPPALPLPAPLR